MLVADAIVYRRSACELLLEELTLPLEPCRAKLSVMAAARADKPLAIRRNRIVDSRLSANSSSKLTKWITRESFQKRNEAVLTSRP